MKWGGADQRLHRVGYLPSLSAGHNVRHWLVPRQHQQLVHLIFFNTQ
jgi:hypothetical protein